MLVVGIACIGCSAQASASCGSNPLDDLTANEFEKVSVMLIGDRMQEYYFVNPTILSDLREFLSHLGGSWQKGFGDVGSDGVVFIQIHAGNSIKFLTITPSMLSHDNCNRNLSPAEAEELFGIIAPTNPEAQQ